MRNSDLVKNPKMDAFHERLPICKFSNLISVIDDDDGKPCEFQMAGMLSPQCKSIS